MTASVLFLLSVVLQRKGKDLRLLSRVAKRALQQLLPRSLLGGSDAEE